MGKRIFVLEALSVYMELVFHIYMGLDMRYAPLFLCASAAWGFLAAAAVSLLPERAGRAVGAILILLMSVVYMAEFICKKILQQYYQIVGGLDTAAGNHLGDYLAAVWQALRENIPGLFLLVVLPLGVWILTVRRAGKKEPEETNERTGKIGRWKMTALALGAAAVFFACFLAGVFFLPWKGEITPAYLARTDLYTDDQVEQLGLGTMLLQDVRHSIFGTPGETMPQVEEAAEGQQEPEEPVYDHNQMDIDFEGLTAAASSDEERWLSEYFGSVQPAQQNEYTGMFEGYNVIFITAEGFSGYMIDPELTPTLYQMSTEGFVFKNFYTPLHFTSTSGGEFQNLTGLYPRAGFPVSLTESGKRSTYLPFTLANALNGEDYTSIGYHFNQNMYGRELSHPNLGYEWRQADACGRPVTKETNESGREYWPQSDDYMVEQTFADYVDREPFNIYYLTISMHLPYGYDSNEMSRRNWEQVEDLPYSDKTKAYMAAGMELEKGLTHLLEDLEEAGIADHTLIAMAPDHVPYSDLDILEELAGRDFGSDSVETLDEENVDLDVYRNTWILWSAGMKEPVEVEKICSQVDILPTMLNLLGVEYDSRLLAGTDVFSDQEGMAIFFSRSWITDQGTYSRYTEEFQPAPGVEMTEEEQNVYVENKKYVADCRLRLGELIIETDYYRKAVP
ncbi:MULTISPECIES: LTA synthase family protein [Eubacteriales]|uniref:LTA synthase family protein n=1 Tax=Eubacteriales TaxID=186802 RepID=UPI000A8392E7|nr:MULTISPECIES: LTA synthase family protein [Eubacteriales]